MLEVTPERFLEACSREELIETQLLLDSQRFQIKMSVKNEDDFYFDFSVTVEDLRKSTSLVLLIETQEQFDTIVHYLRGGVKGQYFMPKLPVYVSTAYSATRGNLGLGYSTTPQILGSTEEPIIVKFNQMIFE